MTDDELLTLLRSNNHFEHPELWLDFARENAFREVSSTRRLACPDCGSTNFTPIGQYIYYSSLIRLQRCGACDLVFSDVLLAPEVIAQHFDAAYKDESYFLKQRQGIFREIAELVATLLPQGGSVLDVGGAKGHLADEIRKLRPDAKIVVNDISQTSCTHAQMQLGFETICGDLAVLSARTERFDVVMGIDVAYYEPQLQTAWHTFAALTAPGGSLLLRIPNRLTWIRAIDACALPFGATRQLTSRVPLFNTEHIYIFSRRYLRRALGSRGFTNIEHRPSAFLASDGVSGLRRRMLYLAICGIAAATRSRILLSSSQLVIAKRSA